MSPVLSAAPSSEKSNIQIVQTAISRITALTARKGVSVNQMLRESGLSKSLLDNMKRGSMPSADKMAALADYFECSVDYLLGRVDQPRQYSFGAAPMTGSRYGASNVNYNLLPEEVDVLRKLLHSLE